MPPCLASLHTLDGFAHRPDSTRSQVERDDVELAGDHCEPSLEVFCDAQHGSHIPSLYLLCGGK